MNALQQPVGRKSQRGVSIITAIFLLLLFAGLAALMANVVSTAHTTSAQDVLGARAYQAARGGAEWGMYQVLDPGNATALSATAELPGCFPKNSLVNGFGATVSVDCDIFPPAGNFQEGSKRFRIYRIVSTAKLPGPNGLSVERRLEVTVEKCRDSEGMAPLYDC